MLTGFICLVVGAFIGWVIPAPKWAQDLIARVRHG